MLIAADDSYCDMGTRSQDKRGVWSRGSAGFLPVPPLFSSVMAEWNWEIKYVEKQKYIDSNNSDNNNISVQF
jgi:hypothetical protein